VFQKGCGVIFLRFGARKCKEGLAIRNDVQSDHIADRKERNSGKKGYKGVGEGGKSLPTSRYNLEVVGGDFK